MCLEHFATFYTTAVRQMLIDLRKLERLSGSIECFYPLSGMAITMSAYLCDLIGVSAPMHGAISESQLETLLQKSPRRAVVRLLTKDGPRVGFQELFSIALVSFHISFLRKGITYMQADACAKETIGLLEKRAKWHNTTESLRREVCDADPSVAMLLSRSGGEAKGWRLARGLLQDDRARRETSVSGIVNGLSRAARAPPSATHQVVDLNWDGDKYVPVIGYHRVVTISAI
mmetsp:Transcript_24148/g.63009  ORF Transcript_24148/g.63009 Transcript_24148/m.63009 type:complete len:231 (-) Transcript_24148:13-705(-)